MALVDAEDVQAIEQLRIDGVAQSDFNEVSRGYRGGAHPKVIAVHQFFVRRIREKYMQINLSKALRYAAWIALCLCSGTQANPLYKCEVNGKIEYQDRPCVAAKQQVACLQGEAQQLKYAKKLTEACQRRQSESGVNGGSGDAGVGYSTGGYGSRSAGKDVNVRGYTKSNGTYVSGHTRSAPGHGRR